MLSVLRNTIVLGLSFALLLGATTAQAQIVPGRPGAGGQTEERVRSLEARVGQLEANLYQMNQRLVNLEQTQRPPQYPQYPTQATEQACLIMDTLVSRSFMGKGRTRIEAEANARQSCAGSVSSTYCNAAAKCTDEREQTVRQGVICVLKDSLVSRTYKGDGKSFIEAEYNARKSCNDSVSSTYCKAEIRCEAY